MKKKFIVLTVTVGVLLLAVVGGTVAWIVDHSNEVVNSFTVGDVSITLTETTGDKYPITPGLTLEKDPTVTVKAGSDACYLFVKIEKSSDFDTFMTYHLTDGWTLLSEADGVYYRLLPKTERDTAYPVLKNHHIRVKETVTEEELDAVRVNPKMSFTAYAIQQTGFDTAELAWNELKG